MTALPVDDDIRRLISRDGLDRTFFVEAGAGTGKTRQLVNRIANLVVEAGVPLADIAAITFTEAAVAELADRIRVTFEQLLAATSDPTEAQRCRAAVADADQAAISTLHGFAHRILASHPLDAGLPPRTTIADEVTSELAAEDRWARFVDRLYDTPAHEELLVRAAVCGVALEPSYPTHATLKDVAAQLAQSWDRLELLFPTDPGAMTPVDFTPFDRAASEVEALAGQCTDPGDKFYVRLVDVLLPSVRVVTGHTDPHRKLAALVAADEWKVGAGGAGRAWGGDVAAAKAAIKALNDARSAVVDPVVDDVLRRLLTLVAREVLDAADARRLEGTLEFHDLLVLARRLLRRSDAARADLHDRYTHLLLDEFQDTDPIQIELAVLIAGAVTGRPPGRWDEVDVDDGRLFFVGDPKQSIYRFRRADITLFLAARDRFGADDAALRLETNFRTVPAVLDWVNQLFGQLMPAEIAGKQPRYEPLAAFRTDSPTGDHRPVLLGGPQPRTPADELREIEAASVARTIDAIRRTPQDWPVFDDKRDAWRPARLADITILVPTRTSLPMLLAALADWQVPFRLNTGTLVYDTQEVRDCLAVLRAVDDPTDRLSLVAALRSPLYACSDVDLFDFHHAGGRWNLRAEPPAGVAADHPVVVALAHLRSLWESRGWSTPSGLLDRLLAERRAFVLGFADGRPKEVWNRLRFLLDQARAFEEAGGGDLRAFVDWAELQRSGSSRVHEPLLPETDDDAVRIMTIHGAKGLEFPITIVSGMTTKPGGFRNGVSVMWTDDGTPEIKLRKGVATADHHARADLELEMDIHERLRLLYVACTRAQDHLVVACHHQDGVDSYASRIWALMAPHEPLWRSLPDGATSTAVAVPRSTSGAAPVDDRAAWLADREALLAPQREARVLSATTIARLATATPVSDDDADDTEVAGGAGTADAPAVTPRRRGRAGTAVGRAVHATLQFLDLAAPDHIVEQATRQAELESIPELADTVAAMVRAALASDTVALATKHPHHRELYVAAPIGHRVVEGYIDLLIEGPDGLVVVDYKTDTVRSEADVDAKLATYELQGAAYAVAVESATGLSVVDCRFVFCRPAGAIERGVDDLQAAKQRVRDLAG